MLKPSNQPNRTEAEKSPTPDSPPAAPAWERPRLVVHGDLRQLTMGGSPGLNESGNEGSRRN